jgi:amino acid transporter
LAPSAGEIWRDLIGPPLRLREAQFEEISSIEGLPALSLDALTSVAYGPEAILIVLGTAGLAALHLIVPVTVAIVALLALLVISYRQVVDGYPAGGGAYAVARANLGEVLSLLAAASLVVDYTLTVAVSIAAGVAALTSAFQPLVPLTVPLCLVMLGVITVLNLRGLGEAARAFLLPTVIFIVGMLAVIAVGLVHPIDPHISQPGRSLVATQHLASLDVLLILKAFASGCSALTGVEAIANGVPLFREPRQLRAKRTEALLGIILAVMLLGLAVLAERFEVVPRDSNTVLSQIMAASVGRSWAYYLVSLSVTAVLGLAANTSFGGLPVLGHALAVDHYAPHFFGIRSDRLVFSHGIVFLAAAAGLLLIAVGGNTNSLIPMFAIGVFTGFTLAQTGMVVHWYRAHRPGWQWRAALNGSGAAATGIATVVFLLTKFGEGGWVVAVTVPVLMLGFVQVRSYYTRAGRALALGEIPSLPEPHPTLVIVPITTISRATAHAISDAQSISSEVIALRVAFPEDRAQADQLEADWKRWNPGVPLKVVHTPFHSVLRPVLRYVRHARQVHPSVVVLIPTVLPRHWWERLLHNQLDLALTAALTDEPGVIVARSPYRIR